MDSECWISCLSINLRRNSLIHIIIAVGMTALVPVIFSISALPVNLAAQPLEFYMTFIGMVLIVPVILPEQDNVIREVVRARRTGLLAVIIMRLIYSAAVLILLYGVVIVLMNENESEVTMYMYFGGVSGALFLGAAGFAGACIVDNAIGGYMVSMFYYIMNYGMGERLGKFNLFAMSSGIEEGKGWLAAGALVLIAAGLIIMRITRRI